MTPSITDFTSLDRDVARAARAYQKFRLEASTTPDATYAEPFEQVRHITGQSTLVALGETSPVTQQLPHRDALRRWVYALLQARLGTALDLEWARAALAKEAHFTGNPARLIDAREAFVGLITSPSEAERALYLSAFAERGPKLGSIAKERAGNRLEIARRLGFAHPAEPTTPAPIDDVRALAHAVLARTSDLAAALTKESLSPRESPTATRTIHRALAGDAPEGWPSRLGARWLDDLAGAGTRGLRIELPRLPGAWGAASFARALASFGYAVRVASSSPSLPFALAREPHCVVSHRFGALFGSLPASADFQRIALGNPKRIAEAQARVLARAALFELRLVATRVVLGDEARPADANVFEEQTTRLFGAPLPSPLLSAWPAPRDDDFARLLGYATALPLMNEVVDRFDVDWWRNPRGLQHLRAIGSAPPWAPCTVDAPAMADALGTTLEKALG